MKHLRAFWKAFRANIKSTANIVLTITNIIALAYVSFILDEKTTLLREISEIIAKLIFFGFLIVGTFISIAITIDWVKSKSHDFNKNLKDEID